MPDFYPDKIKQTKQAPPADEAIGAGTPQQKPQASPAAEPVPGILHPGATVEPFDSAGVPHGDAIPARHSSGRTGLLILFGLMLIVATIGYYLAGSGQPLSTPSAAVAVPPAVTDDFSGSLSGLDSSLGESGSSLTNASSVLDDKSGDLSE